MTKQNLIIHGAGGHAKVVTEIAEALGLEIVCFLEQPISKKTFLGYPVFETVAAEDEDSYVIAIGSNPVRKKIAEQQDKDYIILIHPRATISTRARVGDGTVVMAGATINSEARIGKHCIVNTNASVDHDCVIGDYVHLSPNVALAGGVQVGEGTHIGIGASVIQGIKIGQGCTIGAGAVIIRDIPDGMTVVGNPGRIIKSPDSNSPKT